jgi:hypothetical protein
MRIDHPHIFAVRGVIFVTCHAAVELGGSRFEVGDKAASKPILMTP